MRRTVYFTGFLILAAVLSVSCSKIWRIDPPELLSGTVWMGTNDARGEKLYFCYGNSEVLPYFHEETGVDGTQENGHLEMYFTSPSDTVKYVGTYNYIQYPAVYVKEMYGYIYLNIQNMIINAQFKLIQTYKIIKFLPVINRRIVCNPL